MKVAEDFIRREPKIYSGLVRQHTEKTIDLVSAPERYRTRAKHAIERAHALGYDLVDLRSMPHQDLLRIKGLGRGTLALLVSAGITRSRAQMERREQLFIELATGRLGEEVSRELWAEVDRLEGRCMEGKAKP